MHSISIFAFKANPLPAKALLEGNFSSLKKVLYALDISGQSLISDNIQVHLKTLSIELPMRSSLFLILDNAWIVSGIIPPSTTLSFGNVPISPDK